MAGGPEIDDKAWPPVYQREEGNQLLLGVLLPGFSSRESCRMAALCSHVELTGTVSQLETPSGYTLETPALGPTGPFKRSVQLSHPVDVTTPVTTKVGLGIFEFSFAKAHTAVFEEKFSALQREAAAVPVRP